MLWVLDRGSRGARVEAGRRISRLDVPEVGGGDTANG